MAISSPRARRPFPLDRATLSDGKGAKGPVTRTNQLCGNRSAENEPTSFKQASPNGAIEAIRGRPATRRSPFSTQSHCIASNLETETMAETLSLRGVLKG